MFRLLGMLHAAGVWALTTMTVISASDCPSADAVQARLQALLPGHESSDSVHLAPGPEGLVVEMRSALHRTVLRRTLPGHYTCDEQAALVATLIAAWQVEEGQRSLEPTPQVEAAPITPAPVSPVPEKRARLGYEIAGALTGGVAGGGFAIGGRLDVLLRPGEGRAGLRLGLLGQSARTLPLLNGEVSWLRAGLLVGGGYRFRPAADPRWIVDWFAEAALALVAVRGRGFQVEDARFDADVALGSSARIGRQLGAVRPFLELSILGWMRPQRVSATARQLTTTTLPQLEVLLSLGLTVGGAKKARPAE